eukprot:6471826-Amphidinium_carterae.1
MEIVRSVSLRALDWAQAISVAGRASRGIVTRGFNEYEHNERQVTPAHTHAREQLPQRHISAASILKHAAIAFYDNLSELTQFLPTTATSAGMRKLQQC